MSREVGSMSLPDRLGMYTEAIGPREVGAIFDLARLPMTDDEHRELAGLLAGVEK